MMRHNLFALVAICLAGVPASAETTAPSVDFVSETKAPASVPSITAHLQMQTSQIQKLSRLYDDHASYRLQQEASIARWQNELRQAQAPATFDEQEASRLLRNISEARQAVSTNLLGTRAKALDVLSPVQQSQLEALGNDRRIKVHDDRYFQLLLQPVEDLWRSSAAPAQEPQSSEHRVAAQPRQKQPQQRRRSAGSGSYGVYGGYSYGGPDYGVYGSYGEGPVGVHAGIGRSGPSVGVSVGGVFGGWRR